MIPLAVVLPLLLLQAPPVPNFEAYRAEACPKGGDAEDEDLLRRPIPEHDPACLRREMEVQIDRVIVPLETSSPARFRRWMRVQARHNGWGSGSL